MKMKKLPKGLAKVIRFDLTQKDFMPGFGGYVPGTAPKGRARIYLNVGSILALTLPEKDGKAPLLKPSEIPELVADTVVHEIIHALEDWAGVAFSHRRVNRLVRKYREAARRGKLG